MSFKTDHADEIRARIIKIHAENPGLTYSEIAERLGCDRGTVYRTVRRSRADDE